MISEPSYIPDSKCSRDQLVIKYHRFVSNLCKKMIRDMGLPAACLEDLVSAGSLGLIQAAERYDRASDGEFLKFAFLRIRGAIIDSLRYGANLSGRVYHYAKALQLTNDVEEATLLARRKRAESKVDPSVTLAKIMDFAATGCLAYRLTESEAARELSRIPAEAEDPEQICAKETNTKKILQIIATLPEKERTILIEHYFKDKSLLQISHEQCHLSKSWISRLRAQALIRFKDRYLEAVASGQLEETPDARRVISSLRMQGADSPQPKRKRSKSPCKQSRKSCHKRRKSSSTRR